jgi:tetratricopeptide (TPR) repeat protein
MRTGIQTLLAALLFTAAATAQASLPALEHSAFELKSQGRYAEARDALLDLLARTETSDPLAAARAECSVATLGLLGLRLGDPSLAAKLEDFAATASTSPTLRDRTLLTALELRRAAGEPEATLALQRALGFLTRFQICGPFDNERGQGYARPYEPERGFDPEGRYEGRKRTVGWRPLGVDEAPGGVIDLGASVRPAEQVLVYAATVIESDRATDAALLLGTDGSYRVFLDGTEVGARDLRRRRHPDQDAVPLRLRAGPNLLLLKLCAQDGPLTFTARLRGIDGSPLPELAESAETADLLAATAAGPAEPSDREPARGALDILAARAEAGDAADAFRLATLLALNQPDDPNERRDRALAEQAVAGLPGFSAARYLLAFTRVQLGSAEEKDENARRRDYERILADDPEHAEALRSLAEMELDDLGAGVRAEALCRRALEVSPDFAAARLLLARALDAQDLELLAFDETLRAAAPDRDGNRSPEACRAAADLLLRAADPLGAEPLLAAAASRSASAGAADALARALLRRGARDEALAVLRASARQQPFDPSPRRRIARVLEAAGDPQAAATELRAWLEVCPEDDEVLVELARLAGLQGAVDRQRELLRAALDLNPNRKAEARLLEFLEADELPFHLPYEIDAGQVITEVGGPPADAATANDSHHWVLQQDVVHAYRNGTRSTYQHRIVRVLSDRAVRQFSTWVVRHDFSEQRARILSARIVKPDGRELRPRLRGAAAQLPPLEIGDLIDVRARIDDVAPTFFGDYFGLVHPLSAQDGQPLARSDLTLILDPGRAYRFQEANGAPTPTATTDEAGCAVRRYAMRDLPRAEAEERAPGWKETAPIVRVTTYEDWNAFASWWWNLIRRQSDVSPEMRAKVAELVAGRTDEAEKIAAIYDFVTNDVRYKAWEFGVHGYQPYNTSVIFERRHGDCKDKALLLNALLGEVGIAAWPVLIWAEPARDTDDLSLAMVEHFNHCISYLPPAGDRPGIFLDGTATLHTTDTVPEMDQGARVLVVHDAAGDLLDLPYVDGTANVDDRSYTIDLREDGSGRATVVMSPDRNQEVAFRSFVANEPARRAENLERLLAASFGSVQVDTVEVGDPTDITTPLRLEVGFTGKDLAARQNGSLALRAAFDSSPLQRLTAADSRDLPLLLGAPESEREQIRYRLPAGWTPVELPPPIRIEAPFGRYEQRWSFADGVLTAERLRLLSVPRVEAAEYPEFREFAAEADAADARKVLIRHGGR